MTDICRLCASLKTIERMINITDPKHSIQPKLERCCQIDLNSKTNNNDLLPQKACMDCYLHLNKCWLFAEKVLKAQDILKRTFIFELEHSPSKCESENNIEDNYSSTCDDTYADQGQDDDELNDSPGSPGYTNKEPQKFFNEFNHNENKNKLSFNLKSIIKSMYLKGYTNQDISLKLNLNQKLVSNWINKYEAYNKNINNVINLHRNKELDDIPIVLSTKNLETIPIADSTIKIESELLLYDVITETEHCDKMHDNNSPNEIRSNSNNMETENISAEEDLNNCMDDGDRDNFHYGKTEIVVDIVDTLQRQNFDDDNNVTIINENQYTNEEYLEFENNEQMTDETITTTANCYNENDGILKFITDDEKNENGTINEDGMKKIPNLWTDYLWHCHECELQYPNVYDLREHNSVVHNKRIKYVCVDCPKTFNKYMAFLKHICLRHRPHLNYCCDVCSVCFWNLSLLQKHRTEHSETDRSFVCKTCGKGFRSNSTLQAHSISHLPQYMKNNYICEICYKTFGTKPNFMAHKVIHTGIRNYTCDQCGRSFVQRGNLDNHMLTHASSKPYECNICWKSFKTDLRLLKHKTVHTGLKPHKCKECGREFREKGTLNEHVRIHTGAMPFSCEFCGKKFRFKGVLTTHRRLHTGERPYSCTECNHHFTNWPNYNKHMKRKHGINTSVTVRKPQSIPPSGMPAKAKQNHIVPTVDNLGIVPTSAKPMILHDDKNPSNSSNTSVIQSYSNDNQIPLLNNGTNGVILENNESHLTTAAAVLAEQPTEKNSQQVIITTTEGHALAQYNYLPVTSTLLGFYNIEDAV